MKTVLLLIAAATAGAAVGMSLGAARRADENWIQGYLAAGEAFVPPAAPEVPPAEAARPRGGRRICRLDLGMGDEGCQGPYAQIPEI